MPAATDNQHVDCDGTPIGVGDLVMVVDGWAEFDCQLGVIQKLGIHGSFPINVDIPGVIGYLPCKSCDVRLIQRRADHE